jgi:peptidoglycan/LPS O-acetylase OafA/YrhL
VVLGGHRPFLDGLRAVAVYLVVVFHAGSGRFDGGFVGVDVFFVLSGYLVTQLLLRDLVGSGSVSLGRFYARRFRRLLPAAFVALVVTGLVFSSVASPVEVADARGAFRAAFLYGANWHFVAQSADYFGANVAASPVLHFWSLAVEEQFYVVWPLLLAGLFAVSRRFGVRGWRLQRVAVGLVAAGSLWWAWSLRGSNPDRAYFGTDARAYQLMAGALLALTPGVVAWSGRFARWARVAGVAGLVALVVAASAWVRLDAIERGLLVTVITVAVIVALEAAAGGVANRVLSCAPVVYLGKISYGTYLWHWPVIVVMARAFDLSVVSTVALAVLVATGLASLSYQLMEHPIRVSGVLDRHRGQVIAAGLALSVLSALVIIPRVVQVPATSAAPVTPGGAATTGFTPVPAGLDFEAIKADFPPVINCYKRPVADCTIVTGPGPHLLLIGDSHAEMMIPTFRAIANQQGLTLSVAVRGGCPWQEGLYVPPLEVAGQAIRQEDCAAQRADVYDRVIPQLKPDIIIAMNLGYEQPGQVVQYRGPDGRGVPNPSPEHDALVRRATTDSIARLKGAGSRVLLLEPIPFAPEGFDPLACLSKEPVLAACRFVAEPGPTGLEQLYRRNDAEDERVWALDLDRLVCPYLPICDPIVNGQVVRIDGSHLTRTFGRSLAPAVKQTLQDNGILPR